MKKYIITTALAAIALFSVSCNKDRVEDKRGDYVTLSASVPETKLSFAGENDTRTLVKWDMTDKLWVRSDRQPDWERGVCFKLSSITNNGKTANFSGTVRTDGKLAAVYPYSMVAPGADNNIIKLELAGEYPAAEGSCPSETLAAVAFPAAGSTSMKMEYIFGAIKFILKGNGEKIVGLRLIDNKKDFCLWGDCLVVPDYVKGKIDKISFENGNTFKNKAVLTFQKPKVLSSEAQSFYFTLPEGSLSEGFVLRAVVDDGTERQLSSSKSNTIVRGNVTIMQENTMPATVYTPDSPELPEPEDPAVFSGGKGSVEEPYLISKTQDILELASLCNNTETNPKYHAAHYLMTCDIDMKDIDFTTICFDYDFDAGAFAGCFDGGNHKISNLSAKPVDSGPCGLFGYCRGAVVKNIKMENVKVNGISKVGAIAGTAWGASAFTNCHVTGAVINSANKDMIGGIVGYLNASSVNNCTVTSSRISSDSHNSVGGIAGFMKKMSSISDCMVSSCEISGLRFVGGIIGRTVGGRVLNCVVSDATKISSSERAAGGIGGGDDGTSDDIHIDNCLIDGSSVVKSKFYSGGIVGYIYNGEKLNVTISNCGVEDVYILTVTDDSSGGDGSGDCCTGGIIGWLRNSKPNSTFRLVNNFCYPAEKGFEVERNVIAPSIGGIVGFVSNNGASSVVIAACCTDFERKDLVIAGKVFKEGEELTDSDKVGAIYGKNNQDNQISYTDNCWINDTGLAKIGHGGLSNVVFEANEGYSSPVFLDGTSVSGKLNAFVEKYKEIPLKSWIIRDSRPVLKR